jgi:hypothetical protein
MWQEFIRIFEAFEKAGIIILPIKGLALLKDIYIDKPIRPMTDIDLLVKEESLTKAEEIFCDLGYRKELYALKEDYWRNKQCHITFYKREDEKLPFVELHWSIDFKRNNRSILSELWSRTREIKGDGKIIQLLSPEDTLFSLALHNRRFGRTLCLKNTYDLALVLKNYTSTFDWDYCLSMSKRYNMCSTTFFILYQVKLFLGINIPDFVWGKLNRSIWKRKIIRRFIEKNTFLSDLERRGRDLYLKSHFLLYDNFWEPIRYIFNIPEEQFAKFYGLEPYDKKTNFLYKNRLFYILFKGSNKV